MIAGMELIDAALVVGAGLVAGIVNAMAGGGSLLTVGLLNVFVGLPGLWQTAQIVSAFSSRTLRRLRVTAKKASEVSEEQSQ